MCNPTQLHTINVHQRRWTDICDICQYTVSLHSSRIYSIGIHSYKIFSFAIHCNLIDLASLQGFVWRLTEINQSINQLLGSYIAYQCYCYFKRQVPLVNFKEKFKDLIQKVFCTFYPIINIFDNKFYVGMWFPFQSPYNIHHMCVLICCDLFCANSYANKKNDRNNVCYVENIKKWLKTKK